MEKKNRADKAAEEFCAIQKRVAPRAKITECLMLATFSAMLIFGALGVWLLPQKDFSANENRYLATAEKIDALGDIKSGAITKKLADMYADQFPFRSEFIELKALFELAAQRGENNGVMLLENGKLVPRLEYGKAQKDIIDQNIAAIEAFSDKLSECKKSVTVAIAPRSIDVFFDNIAPPYSKERAFSVWEQLDGADRVDFLPCLESHGEEYLWFKTDHHWTVRGAYYAYLSLADELEIEPMSDFEFLLLDGDFFGTSWSKSGMYWIGPDALEGILFDGIEDFKVIDGESGEIYLSGLYDIEKLETKDKYSVFLGGDHGHIKISDGKEKPTLMVIKDSYFNSLAPYLCRHFELDVIDLRYYRGSVKEYAKKTGADKILVLCGIDSLANAKTFTALYY